MGFLLHGRACGTAWPAEMTSALTDQNIDLLMTSAQPGPGIGCPTAQIIGKWAPGTGDWDPDPGSGSGARDRGLIMNPKYDTWDP